jgi:hypothetical protein
MKNGTTPQTDTVYVTYRKKQVLGVNRTVVRDTVTSRGRPVERTFDWYAQDRKGNVWYMGEETQELMRSPVGASPADHAAAEMPKARFRSGLPSGRGGEI